MLFYGKSLEAPQQAVKTDHDTVRASYRFLRSSEDDQNLEGWEQKLAKRYYEKLFKVCQTKTFNTHTRFRLSLFTSFG